MSKSFWLNFTWTKSEKFEMPLDILQGKILDNILHFLSAQSDLTKREASPCNTHP